MTVSIVRLSMRVIVRSTLGLIVAGSAVAAHAQGAHSVSVGASYTYVRSNILPGCACFSLNGGSAEAQFGLTHHVALFADVTAVHKGGITQDNYKLTQYTYVGGVRFMPNHMTAKLQPFVEAAVGGANTTGTLSPLQTGLGSAHAFVLQGGGGLEIQLSHRISVVPAHVDYLLTTFANGSQNRQNDLQVSAGFRLRLRY